MKNLFSKIALLAILGLGTIGFGSCTSTNAEFKNAEMHKVTFVANNGIFAYETNVEHGQALNPVQLSAARSAVDSKISVGFEFLRWDLGSSLLITSDTVFSAVVTIKTFTVYYVDGDYTGASITRTVAFGDPVPVIDAPANIPSGQVFLSWHIPVKAVTADTYIFPVMSGISKYRDSAGHDYYIRPDGAVFAGFGSSIPTSDFVIPDTVMGTAIVAIGVRAFDGLNWGYKLTISPKIITIGARAFAASHIKNIDFNRCRTTLKEVRAQAFLDAYVNAVDGILPSDLDFIGFEAFRGSSNNLAGITSHLIIAKEVSEGAYRDSLLAQSFHFSPSVVEIGNYAFYDQRQPVGINLSNASGLVTIGTNAFSRMSASSYSFSSISFPANAKLKTIKDGAFNATIFAPLSVRLDFSSSFYLQSVVSIGDRAFANNSGITFLSIDYSSSLESIGRYAFESCGNIAGNLTFSSRITFMGEGAFRGMNSNLKGQYTLSWNSPLAVAGSAFQNCQGFYSVFVSPITVGIEPYAFNGCEYLYKVDLYDSYTTGHALGYIGSGAFGSCFSEAKVGITIAIPHNVNTIGDYAFTTWFSGTTFDRIIDVTKVTNMALMGRLNSSWSSIFTIGGASSWARIG